MLTNVGSKIILVLLSVGEAYLIDLRDVQSGRTELLEVQDELDVEHQQHRCAPWLCYTQAV